MKKEELTQSQIYEQMIMLTDFINNRNHTSTIDNEVYDLAIERLNKLLELAKQL